MREITTHGDICLKGKYNLIYRVAEITYIEREDDKFVYEIRPDYSVIELLDAKDFQGIPGLNLDLKKESYVRENIVPTFISERTPGENREDLRKLLNDCNMEYLNRLEWLIRTDTQYSGDKLFVQRPETKNINVDSIKELGNRSAVICRKLLETICYGDIVSSSEICVSSTNRKQYYELLTTLYGTERKYLDSQRKVGIAESAGKGKYRGRIRIKIGTLESMEVFTDYRAQKISSIDAAKKLGISKSTFLRRYREYIKTRQ